MTEPQVERTGERHPPQPAASAKPCAHCGKPVDPLRAARVAIYRERFRYFCSAECRSSYDPDARRTPIPTTRSLRTAAAVPGATPVDAEPQPDRLDAPPAEAGQARLDPAERGDEWSDVSRGGPASSLLEEPEPSPPAEIIAPPQVGLLLIGVSLAGATLGILLALAGGSGTVLMARAVVIGVACAALVAEYALAPRDASYPHPAALLAAPCGAAAIAIAAVLSGQAKSSAALTFAALVIAALAGALWLVQRTRRQLDWEREALVDALNQPARRVAGEEVQETPATELRPGEELLLEPSDVVPVDVTVSAGSALVLPWLGARTPERREEGSSLVAGARVVEGRLRVIVAWAGHDRAWIRLTNDPRRRADIWSGAARIGRHAAERWSPVVAALAALTAYAGNQDWLGVATSALAGQAALASIGLSQIGSLHVLRTVLTALHRGIVYRAPEALDRAGRVQSAAFCARGTLLLGEPEVTNVEGLGAHDPETVLSLVAGAETGAAHPVATAVLRAARARSVRPDAVRSPSYQPGLGVTAVASNGQPLVVGNRALMLKERISVAVAEPIITDLEAMGRTVLLAALGGKLIGMVGLQDGLRPGARAAVQHLLDVAVEPVLMSGESRETCDALARALDIEHVRPEVLPAERGDEIRRLSDGGAVVAVIGRTPTDEVALAAADVSVALATAGSTTADYSVQLCSDDVRDAAYALRLAHRCKTEARTGLTVTLASGIIGALAVAFSLAPPAFAPVAALGGTLAALIAWRSETR